MTHRDNWLPPVLSMVTCGAYFFYWQYVTTEELKTATAREDLNPTTDLIFSLLCCGLWSIYVQYRNAQVIHEYFVARGLQHEDKSTMILMMHALTAVSGMTGMIGMMIAQDELNKMATLTGGAPPQTF